jgi:enoyl-CoA hydratase/carnithine racemase
MTVQTGASPSVLFRREGRVAVVTMHRPEARNALNRALLTELQAAIDVAAADSDIGVLVLTGSGSAFCAGADMKESASAMAEAEFWDQYERTTQSMRIHQQLPRLRVPVIAAVNGAAVAGGCGLAMSCDIVVASEAARFGYPEVSRGLVAAMVMVSLSRIVGRRQALELLVSGRLVDAYEALQLGMINRVVPHDDLMPEVMTYASEMAARSPGALRVTKDLFRHVLELDYDRALEYARDVNQMLRQTRDAQDGTSAFANRRGPHE